MSVTSTSQMFEIRKETEKESYSRFGAKCLLIRLDVLDFSMHFAITGSTFHPNPIILRDEKTNSFFRRHFLQTRARISDVEEPK